jgi:zinc/manganese transport system permease protein
VPLLADSPFSWNPIEDVRRLFEFHFMVNAFRAGTVVAVVAGVIGWFMVLRRQTFAGHTLSVVAFPGAAGATLVGISALFGYFGFCVVAALAIALVPRAGAHGTGEESAVIGTVQAFALACGFLFVTLYGGLLDGVNSLLFGSFLGITDGQVLTLGLVGAGALLVVAAIGRPLLFASLDPDVAAAHGVPVRGLSVVFLVVLGVAVAEASQVTGALLVFALLVVPPATAQLLTPRPLMGIVVSVGIGVAVTWLGLACSYFTDQPIGFFVTTLAFVAYLLAHATLWLRRRRATGAPERAGVIA